MKRAIIETLAAAGWALAVVMAVLGSSCQREECPVGTTEQWTPAPDRADLRACVASQRSVYYCMRDMGYSRVCR
jgi:hypothetical protein